MKILYCTSPGKFEYRDVGIPTPRENESLIRIAKVGVCGTDLHAFEGTQPYFEYPRVLGHEIAATFVSGDTTEFIDGESVTVLPYFNCFQCAACRSGKPNCCERLAVCGVHIDGAWCEYLVVPSHALVKGQGLALDQLAIVEPLAIGAHCVNRAGIKKGEYVLVIGAGPIGIGVMEMARLAGGIVIAMDVNSHRLEFIMKSLGIEKLLNPRQGDIIESLRELTNDALPSVVIDATGNRNAILEGFKYIGHGGRYILVGLQKEDITFSHPLFHKKETTLMSSRNALRSDFEFVINALTTRQITLDGYISHRVDFNDVATVFPSFLVPSNNVIKALIEVVV